MPSGTEVLDIQIARSLFGVDNTPHNLVIGVYAIGHYHICSAYAGRVEATDEF